MDLVAGVASDNGPILYTEPNRTSAVDDLRSLVIYVFIITIFLSFFLILPGVRSDKFPTFLCVTSSLLVTSIILLSLFGTTWHTGQAFISAPYKAFSVDRIHGELSVRIGLGSVNISLRAHKYYELGNSHRQPILMLRQRPGNGSTNKQQASVSLGRASSSSPLDRIDLEADANNESSESAATTDTDGLEIEAAFAARNQSGPTTRARSRRASTNNATQKSGADLLDALHEQPFEAIGQLRYTVERSNVDINYNERFYWIEPNQMRQEHQSALERGLPYPILTVVEYLSQDEAGFSWSRQYRLAGYYTNMLLTCALCLCLLMFFLHCATPKYGIYAMQTLGCLLLFTNFTYSTLVPRGDQRLVIPFEGRSLSFQFGWSYWLVFIGGCISLTVGTLIVIIDGLFPNYIFTTILDVDFDSHNNFLSKSRQLAAPTTNARLPITGAQKQLDRPPFMLTDRATMKRPSFIADETTEPFASANRAAVSGRPSLLRGHTNLALEEEPEEEEKQMGGEHAILPPPTNHPTESPLAANPNGTEMVNRHRQRPDSRQQQVASSSVLQMLAD